MTAKVRLLVKGYVSSKESLQVAIKRDKEKEEEEEYRPSHKVREGNR